MARWNRFSAEVQEERRQVRAYGVDKVQDCLPEPDSYKGQALRQLALRLELEEELKAAREEVARLVDKLESAGVRF